MFLNIILTWNDTFGFRLADKMCVIDSAALTGTVDFSTTILSSVATWAIFLAQDSTCLRSAPLP